MLKNLFSKTGRNTTVAAVGIVMVVIGQILNAQFDGNPETVPDFKVAGASLLAAWGLFKARDDGNGSAGPGANQVTP